MHKLGGDARHTERSLLHAGKSEYNQQRYFLAFLNRFVVSKGSLRAPEGSPWRSCDPITNSGFSETLVSSKVETGSVATGTLRRTVACAYILLLSSFSILPVLCPIKQAIDFSYWHSDRLCRSTTGLGVPDCPSSYIPIVQNSTHSAWRPIYLSAPQLRHWGKMQIKDWHVEKHPRR